MTYASALALGQNVNAEIGLIISGIPVLFGSKADMVLTTSSIFQSGAPASLTSNDALVRDSVGVSGLELDYKMLMVPPGGGQLRIRSGTWDRYFERRRVVATGVTKARLTAQLTGAATSCTTSAPGAWSVGDVIHVDREAIYVGSLTSSDPATLTRNYAGLVGTKPAIHQAGAVVSKSPRALMGKLAELRMWVSDTDSALLRRLVVSNVTRDPEKGDWVVTFKDAMELFDRVIAKGVRGDTLVQIVPNGSNAELQKAGGTWSAEWGSGAGVANGDVLVRSGDNYVLAPVQSFTASNDPVVSWEVRVQSFLDTLGLYNNVASEGVEMRRVYVLTGSPMVAMLKVLLSDRGDGNNHATYDVLYGRTSTGTGAGDALGAGEEEVRYGAAVPAALLDLTTLTGTDLLRDPGIGTFVWVVGADGEERLLDMMAEVAWHLQGFWFINSSGLLSFKRLSSVYASTTVAATLTEDQILRASPLTAADDETEVVTAIQLKCNWDHGAKEFLGTVNLNYPRTAETYRDVGQVMELERKSLQVKLLMGGGNPAGDALGSVSSSLTDVQFALNRYFFRRQNGLRKWSLLLPISFHQLQPGDVLSVTHEAMPDFAGNGLTAQKVEITKQGALDLKRGTVLFEVTETWSAKVISVTGKISSIAGVGPYTITLATNSKYGGGTTPARQFAAGWKLKILDQSASPPFSAESGTMTVSSISSDTVLVVTGTLGIVPAAGDILVQAAYATADNTTANASQGVDQRGHAFQGTTGYALGTGTPPAQADEWG